MDITRKRFLQSLAGSTMVVLIPGCGGGGYGGGTTTTSAPYPGTAGAACGSSGAAISGNHGHQLDIAAADLDSSVAISYSILGTATHDHQVTLTAAQLASLKTPGTMLTVTSTDGGAGHTHVVTVSCM